MEVRRGHGIEPSLEKLAGELARRPSIAPDEAPQIELEPGAGADDLLGAPLPFEMGAALGVGKERPRALAPQAKPVWSEDATPAKQQITTSLPSGSTDGYQETATLARRGHS